MTIRTATAGDAPALARIFNQYVAKATMVLTPRTAADYQLLLTSPRCLVFVAESTTGEVTGYASVKPYSDRGGYVLAGEVSVFLDRAHAGQGTGSALYEQLLPGADALGYRHLTAKIWADNTGSIRFHRRFGFRTVGTQVGIGWVNEKRVDAVILEKVW